MTEICRDPEILKVLPLMSSKRILICMKSSRERYAKMRPLIHVCKQVIDADGVDAVRAVLEKKVKKKEEAPQASTNNNPPSISLIITELNRETTLELCKLVRNLSHQTKKGQPPAPLIPIIIIVNEDEDGNQHGHDEALKKCLGMGALGYLNEPVHLGQLVMTAGLVMQQYDVIHKVYSALKRDGAAAVDTKSYPKFELAHVRKHVANLRGSENFIREQNEGREGRGISESNRVGLWKDGGKKKEDGEHHPEGGGGIHTEGVQNYSLEIREHIIKPPPLILSPRSVCGLSRSRVDKALVIAKIQSRSYDTKKATTKRDLTGKSIIVKKQINRRKGMGEGTKVAIKEHKMEHLPEHHKTQLVKKHLNEIGEEEGTSQTMHTQIEYDINTAKDTYDKKKAAVIKELHHTRRSSTDAPIRRTIVSKAIQGYTQNNKKFFNQLKGNPGAKDLSQYRLVEIEPPYNKSSRSSHFVSNGYREYGMGNYWPSVNIFTLAIETNSNNWLAHFWRGCAFDKVGHFIRAITDFTNSVKIRTRLAKEEAGDGLYNGKEEREEPLELAAIYYNRGIVYTHVGNDSAALSDFNSALKRDEGNIVFRHMRAIVSRRFGKYGEARDDYVKLWMERNVNNVITSPHPEAMRPQTMSSFRAKSRYHNTENIRDVLSRTRGSSRPNLQRPLTGVMPPIMGAAGGSMTSNTIVGYKNSNNDNSLSKSTKLYGGNSVENNNSVHSVATAADSRNNIMMGGKGDKMIREATMVDVEESIFSADGM